MVSPIDSWSDTNIVSGGKKDLRKNKDQFLISAYFHMRGDIQLPIPHIWICLYCKKNGKIWVNEYYTFSAHRISYSSSLFLEF